MKTNIVTTLLTALFLCACDQTETITYNQQPPIAMDYLRLPTNPPAGIPPQGFVDIYFDTATDTIKYKDPSGTTYPMGGEAGVEAATPSTVVKRTSTGQVKAVSFLAGTTLRLSGEMIERLSPTTGDVVAQLDISSGDSGAVCVLPYYATQAAAEAAGLGVGDLYYVGAGAGFKCITELLTPP